MGGYNWGLTGECGKCYEVMCVAGKTRGRNDSTLGPWEGASPCRLVRCLRLYFSETDARYGRTGCQDEGRRSVVVKISDRRVGCCRLRLIACFSYACPSCRFGAQLPVQPSEPQQQALVVRARPARLLACSLACHLQLLLLPLMLSLSCCPSDLTPPCHPVHSQLRRREAPGPELRRVRCHRAPRPRRGGPQDAPRQLRPAGPDRVLLRPRLRQAGRQVSALTCKRAACRLQRALRGTAPARAAVPTLCACLPVYITMYPVCTSRRHAWRCVRRVAYPCLPHYR